MVFSSLSECISYVKKAQSNSTKRIAEMQEKELQEEVQMQVYNAFSPNIYMRTYALYNNISAVASGNSVLLRLINDGSWHSVYTGESVYAFDTLEAGTTWGRGGTNIRGSVMSKLATKTPQVYKSAMISMGVPIK